MRYILCHRWDAILSYEIRTILRGLLFKVLAKLEIGRGQEKVSVRLNHAEVPFSMAFFSERIVHWRCLCASILRIVALRASLEIVEKSSHCVRQIAGDDRFLEVCSDSHRLGTVLVDKVTVSGTENDGDIQANPQQLVAEFYPRHFRHGLVGDDQIESARI